MNSISAVPRIDTTPEHDRANTHNGLKEPMHHGEDSLHRRMREHIASQRENESRHTIPESPPTPGYFRPEFPYEKRWKVHRAGMDLKRPKIKSIGRLNPEILLRRHQNTENDQTSQAVTVSPVLRMETTTQNSPPRLASLPQHIAGVREDPSSPNLNSTFSQGLHNNH